MSFVAASAEATGFHHPEWALLLAESFSLRGAVLAVIDDGGEIVAGLPALQAPRALGRSPPLGLAAVHGFARAAHDHGRDG